MIYGSRLAFDKCELVAVEAGPRDKGRATGAPATLAVAMRDAIRRPKGAVTNRATKAASFNRFHNLSLGAISE